MIHYSVFSITVINPTTIMWGVWNYTRVHPLKRFRFRVLAFLIYGLFCSMFNQLNLLFYYSSDGVHPFRIIYFIYIMITYWIIWNFFETHVGKFHYCCLTMIGLYLLAILRLPLVEQDTLPFRIAAPAALEYFF